MSLRHTSHALALTVAKKDAIRATSGDSQSRRTMQPTKLVGASPAIATLQDEIFYAARCDAKVLITGESGAGKEIVARLIHAASARSRSALVTVNCAALTETLLETELFGHVRGSFTGAYRDRLGAFEQAHRGTVFMDEVGETSPRMQGLLLRFLETGEIQRVGSDQVQTRVDVRVIAATNRVLVDARREQDLPRRSLLPPERDSPPGSAAARARRRHSGASSVLSRSVRASVSGRMPDPDGRSDADPRRTSVAGQRARAQECR